MENNNIYFVRAEEKKTVYGITMFKVKAESPEEAKQKVLNDDNSIEVTDAWDNCTEDIEYVESKNWEINKGEGKNNSLPKSDFEIRGDTIYFKSEALALTPAEYEVLTLLVKNQGITQSREQIINTSGTMSIDSQGKSLDVIISKIRTKLSDNKRIQAVRGVGYKLV
jgi:hypothetical protein